MIAAALIILGPLAAAAAVLVARRWSALIAVAGVSISLGAAIVTLIRVDEGERPAATLPGLPGLPLRLVVDPLGALLATTVAAVSVAVFLYAVGYMREEDAQPRFFAAMSFFVAAMQTLVFAGDWVLFLVAWELIALASYLLIGFWYERPGVAAAASRAFATTRAADVGLYIGVLTLISTAGTSEIAETLTIDGTPATVAGLALLAGAMGKSAQAPLQGWLQDAMAGPTPVSALLHSATLVVAGVVLLTRASPLLSDNARLAVAVVGGVTAVVTGLMAVAQRDLKRLLAASTSSQLGLMLVALGAGSVGAAMFHLVANAAMKSTLFLGAGVFQHARHSTEFSDLNGIGRQRRGAFVAVTIAALALAGVPPLAGFWSKDAVIQAALHAPAPAVIVPLTVAASVLTGVYVGRTLRLLTSHDGRGIEEGAAAQAEPWMGAGLGVLAILSATLGMAAAPISELLDAEIPEGVAALALGLAAAVTGLTAGWLVPARRLLGPLRSPALVGFRVRGGVEALVLRPALALGAAGNRLDELLHGIVIGTGRRALRVAAAGRRLDARVHAVVEGAGVASLTAARLSRLTDEAGIDRLISALVDSTRRLGGSARRLQSGLVHRELLVASAATAAILVVIVFV